jgi:transposase InsO family protein
VPQPTRRASSHCQARIRHTPGARAWATQQIVHAFPDETGRLPAPRSRYPQNPFAERVIGSIRRECLDLVIVLNEHHLRRVLRTYLAYYNVTRPHQSLANDSPRRREVQSGPCEHIVSVPEVGGLHHRYQRVA